MASGWGTQTNGVSNDFQGGGIYGQFGNTSQSPDLLGMGMYSVPGYTINQQSYVNPVGDQSGAWQSGMNNYAGVGNSAYGPPSMQAAQLGNATMAQGGDMGQFNQGYGGMANLANQYAQMAAGKGPSLAAVTAQQQGQANLQAQMAAAGTAHGGNPALAQYNLGQQAGQIANQTAQNAVMGRTAEEMGAMGAEGGLYGQMASGGLNAAQLQQQNNQFNAGNSNAFLMQNNQNQQNANLANMQSQLGTNQLNAQQYNNYMQQLYGMNQQQFGAQQNYEQLGVQQQLGVAGIQAQAYQNAAKQNSGFWGGMMGGLGSFMGGMF